MEENLNNIPQYSEKQHFRQFWLWALLVAVICIMGLSLIGQDALRAILPGEKHFNPGILVAVVGTVLVAMFFLVLRLDTIISEEGISYRFFPIHTKYRMIPWTDISRVEVRQYKPIRDFGGWGIRIGLFGKGRAVNVSGNKGIQIIFRNQKKLLIGTRKPEEVKKVLRDLGKL